MNHLIWCEITFIKLPNVISAEKELGSEDSSFLATEDSTPDVDIKMSHCVDDALEIMTHAKIKQYHTIIGTKSEQHVIWGRIIFFFYFFFSIFLSFHSKLFSFTFYYPVLFHSTSFFFTSFWIINFSSSFFCSWLFFFSFLHFIHQFSTRFPRFT